MRSGVVGDVAAGILAVCALVVTGLLVKRELFPSVTTAAPAIQTIADWSEYAAAGQRMGPAQAPVTMIEFSDFQCPFCRMLAMRIDSLQHLYPGQIAVVYRHFPMADIHPHAVGAALASECAGQQHRFEQYYRLLFSKQDSIGRVDWIHFAVEAQVPDTVTFAQCVRDSVTVTRVREDMAAGSALGVTGTPGLLINDQFIPGAPQMDRLNSMVRSALRSAKSN